MLTELSADDTPPPARLAALALSGAGLALATWMMLGRSASGESVLPLTRDQVLELVRQPPPDADPDAGQDDIVRKYQLAVWEQVDDGVRVRLRVPRSWPGSANASLTAHARLGGLTTAWEQGPWLLEPGEVLAVDIDPPDSAWLDPLAADYATLLRVHVDIAGIQGQLEPAALSWPEGEQEAPAVQSMDQLFDTVANGVFDDTRRAELAQLLPPDAFVQAPINANFAAPVDDSGLQEAP